MSRCQDDFFPIPAWPGYSVSRLGQVRGKTGVLSCDAKSRVRLRNGQRYTLSYVGALMEQAGLLASPNGAPAATPAERPERENELLALRSERDDLKRQIDGLREELSAASETISRGRRLNGHLLALVRQHQGKPPQETVAREELA